MSDSTTVDWSDYPPGPTREFIVPGGDNVVQEFGREGSPAERRQASAVVEGWMRARAAGSWAGECRYLHAETIESVKHSVANYAAQQARTCRTALKAFLAGARKKYGNDDNMTGPIDSLRVGEGHGYAQYHGNEGRDWVVPVRKEDGEWKVAGTEPLDRLK